MTQADCNRRLVILVGCLVSMSGGTGCQSSLRGSLADSQRRQFHDDAVRVLQGAALSDDPYVTSNAIEALGDVAPAQGQVCIEKNLDTGNPAVTFAALCTLGSMHRCELLDRYRKLASDGDPNVRIAAIYAMHRCGDTSRTGQIGTYLVSDPQPTVRANAALVLGRMQQPSASKVLREALAHEHYELTRRSILEALANLKDNKGVSGLMANGYSADPGQATSGLWALANARCTEAEGLFLDRLHRAEAPEVRLEAARGLGRIGYAGGDANAMFDLALAHLFFRTTKVKDPNEPADQQIRRVRALAALALEAMGRQDALESLRTAFDAPGQSEYVRVAIARAAVGIMDLSAGRATASADRP